MERNPRYAVLVNIRLPHRVRSVTVANWCPQGCPEQVNAPLALLLREVDRGSTDNAVKWVVGTDHAALSHLVLVLSLLEVVGSNCVSNSSLFSEEGLPLLANKVADFFED